MKRLKPLDSQAIDQAAQTLAEVLASMSDSNDIAALLKDLCTPSELESLADRWRVVPLLTNGVSYRDIHEQTGVSVTTTGRVARCLAEGQGYVAALKALGLPTNAK